MVAEASRAECGREQTSFAHKAAPRFPHHPNSLAATVRGEGRRAIEVTLLHEEGISCAVATLDAIHAADYFGTAPSDDEASERHNHGCRLLAMLADHLACLQTRIDALYADQQRGAQ